MTETMSEIEKAKRETRLQNTAKILVEIAMVLAGIMKLVFAVVIVFVTVLVMAAKIATSMGSSRS